MIDTDKYEGHSTDGRIWYQYSEGITSDYTDGKSPADEADAQLIADAPKLLAEVKRLREEVKVLSKYRDVVIEFDDALLADGDTDMRWSAIYDERVFE